MYGKLLKNGAVNMPWLESLKPLTPLIIKHASKLKRTIHVNNATFVPYYTIIIADETAKLGVRHV
jgi:hypothetical protein